jgi:hypothetical protein
MGIWWTMIVVQWVDGCVSGVPCVRVVTAGGVDGKVPRSGPAEPCRPVDRRRCCVIFSCSFSAAGGHYGISWNLRMESTAARGESYREGMSACYDAVVPIAARLFRYLQAGPCTGLCAARFFAAHMPPRGDTRRASAVIESQAYAMSHKSNDQVSK